MMKTRLVSLDACRGITMAAMLLVNNPGSWDHVYPPLRHAEWHGWTPTDLVFPFFLFIVGISISLALSKRLETGGPATSIYLKIAKRTLIIFALGLLLNFIPSFDLAHLRIPGVLQRIAVCYLLASLVFLKARPIARAGITLACLAAYWLIMKFVPVPGFGAGDLSLPGNLCSYIDLKLMAGHLYQPAFDPEGLLSTLPAVATTLLGTFAGDWLRSSKSALNKTFGLFISGLILTTAGIAFHPFFPINKQLWTSTFVLFTAGGALLLLAICFSIIDGLGLKKWAGPFLVFGTNAIAIYAGSGLMARLLNIIKIAADGQSVPVKEYFFAHILEPLAGPMLGSLLFALLFIALWLLAMYPLYKKKIYIKI
jgi:predicted acyltransferase